jgi:hypothetical protein
MYEGPAAQADKQAAEDYLLGKVYKPKNDEQTDLHKMSKLTLSQIMSSLI